MSGQTDCQAPWTTKGDSLIRQPHADYGSEEARIAPHFGGWCTNNSMKNHWNHQDCYQFGLNQDSDQSELSLPELPIKSWTVSPQPNEMEFTGQTSEGNPDVTSWCDQSLLASGDWFGDRYVPEDWLF
jgi:hypothetical protein